jgi:hypothetical protein
MCLVAFIACILKKPDIEEEDGAGEDLNNVIAAHDEEMLHKNNDELDGNSLTKLDFIKYDQTT